MINNFILLHITGNTKRHFITYTFNTKRHTTNDLIPGMGCCFLHMLEHYSSEKLPLQWRHNRRDDVSNHHPHDCLLNRSFRRKSRKTSKLRVIGLCAGSSPLTGEFPAQMASNAETFPFDDVIMIQLNVFLIWQFDFRYHHYGRFLLCCQYKVTIMRGKST